MVKIKHNNAVCIETRYLELECERQINITRKSTLVPLRCYGIMSTSKKPQYTSSTVEVYVT